MKKKILKASFLSALLVGCVVVIVVFEVNQIPAGSSIAGILFGALLPFEFMSIQDFFDSTSWKTSQRRLKRGGFINNETFIRVSFAYLYRIKVDDKYFLIQNGRNTGKYQPVGGVYKLHDEEKTVLKNEFHVVDDDKISIDDSSKNDYRLRVKSKYLRAFVKRFDKGFQRETILNLSREFKEELVDNNVLSWKQIKYRYCGRHIGEIKFGEHFQTYELLLADIVELLPTEEQLDDLRKLQKQSCELYCFATSNEILSLGVKPDKKENTETIGDHTKKILQEKEDDLIKTKEVNKTFSVYL